MASGLALTSDAWASSLERHPLARTGFRILVTERYDAWLLRWPVGTAVSPHHHGDSEVAFAVSSGALRETRWLDGRREERLLTHGQATSVGQGVVHDVAAEIEALSVHVYSPPLVRMAFFDDQAKHILLEEPVDPGESGVAAMGLSFGEHRGGLDAVLTQARERISPRMQPNDLAAAMDLGALVVDTRPIELRQRDGEVEGALVIDRNVLEWRLDPYGPHRIQAASDADRPVVIVCDEGYASSLAAVSLLGLGRRNVTDLDGGYQAWKRSTQCERVGASKADQISSISGPFAGFPPSPVATTARHNAVRNARCSSRRRRVNRNVKVRSTRQLSPPTGGGTRIPRVLRRR